MAIIQQTHAAGEASGNTASCSQNPGRYGKQARGPRRWAARLSALVISLLLGLGLAEIAAMWLKLAPPVYPAAETAIVLYYRQPNGPVRLTPDWKGFVSGQWTEINEKGFRDRVFPAEPPEGTVRVAILGDSYTMGDGVPLDATYPKQLERLLANRLPCEVMNCGISATNSSQQLEVLRDVLRDYRPHLVVLGYNINDFQQYKKTRFEQLQEAGFTFQVQMDGTVKMNPAVFSATQQVKATAYKHSYLYRSLVRIRDTWTSRNKVSDESNCLKRVQGWIDSGGHFASFAAVAEMGELCRDWGSSFLVVVLPDLLDTPLSMTNMSNYPYGAEHRMIGHELALRGIHCIDALPCFADENLRRVVVSSDRHFNRAGNGLVAKRLQEPVEAEIRKHPTRSGS